MRRTSKPDMRELQEKMLEASELESLARLDIPPDPLTYDDAMSGVDTVGWRAIMAEERRSAVEHDVFEWVDSPQGIQTISSRYTGQVVLQRRRKALPTEVDSGSARFPRGLHWV